MRIKSSNSDAGYGPRLLNQAHAACEVFSPPPAPTGGHAVLAQMRFARFLLSLLAMEALLVIHLSGSPIPPFLAKGTVDTRLFRTTTDLFFKQEAHFVFQWSNGWWQLEVAFDSPPELSGSSMNCKRIRDGVRVVDITATTSTNALPVAVAYPIPFPPPERPILLVCWMALCPYPELPLLDGNRTRRLIASQFHDDPRNQGRFLVQYADPANTFLSEFTIYNNGIRFFREGRTTHYPHPFQDGFREFEFRVLDRTNLGGLPIPTRATLALLSPALAADSVDDLYASAEAKFILEDIHNSNGPLKAADTIPARMFALDGRFKDLAENVSVNYRVTNDSWLSVTNHNLKQLASVFRAANARKARNTPWVARLVMVAFFLAPGVLALSRLRRKHKQSTNEKLQDENS